MSRKLRFAARPHPFFRQAAILSFLLPFATGCATFSQQYFIEVEENRPGWVRPHSEFIRLDLKGYAFWTTSKFEKGWFDKEAVDSLFSTVVTRVGAETKSEGATSASQEGASPSQPQGPQAAGSQSQSKEPQVSRAPFWRRVRVFGPQGEEIKVDGKRLVIFVTSNPKDLLSRIETTVRTIETSEQFARLLLLPQLREAEDAALALSLAGKQHEAVVGDVKSLLDRLKQLPAGQGGDAVVLGQEIAALIKKLDAAVVAK